MKTMMKRMLLVPLLATLATAPLCADAHADGHDGGWWVLPAMLGGALIFEAGEAAHPQTVYVPAPPAYYPQPIYVQQPGYVVQSTLPPAQAAAAPQNWYYCASGNGYYPYVRACPGGWQPVSPIPPDAATNIAPSAPPPPH